MRFFLAAGLLLAASGAQACFLSGEDTNGMNKICYYNCVSGKRAITISAVSLCPLSLSQSPSKQPLYGKGPIPAPIIIAHSGGTDKEGCHTDHKTGYRHCH